jgi:opacity protein-like surface antigen
VQIGAHGTIEGNRSEESTIMKKLNIAGTALLVMALAAPSFAGIDEGDWELGIGGGLALSEAHDNWALDVSLGYFVAPEIAVGGWFGYHSQSLDVTVEGGDGFDWDLEKTWWEIAFFVKYYFATDGEWLPYIGAFAGYETAEIEEDYDGDDWDADRDGYLLGAILGVQYFVSDKTSIFFEYRLTWRDEDEWDADEGATFDDDAVAHLFQFGVRVSF